MQNALSLPVVLHQAYAAGVDTDQTAHSAAQSDLGQHRLHMSKESSFGAFWIARNAVCSRGYTDSYMYQITRMHRLI